MAFLREHRGDALMRTTDVDVENAAAALAATYETAARGLIYEQQPNSLPAQRLAADLKAFIAQAAPGRGSSLDRDLAVVFRAVERGSREACKTLPGGDTAYLELVQRLIVPSGTPAQAPQRGGVVQEGGSLLIRP